MDTISVATAAVTGARHLRMMRNGQDAVASYKAGDVATGDARGSERGSDFRCVSCLDGAVVVVADGCGSGASSEVGARLGATLFARAVGARLERGASAVDRRTWEEARAELVAALHELVERIAGRSRSARELIHDYFLFTIVGAAWTPDGAAVWAIGDGAYSFATQLTQLKSDPLSNAPPYVAYDLVDEPCDAHFAIAPAGTDTIVIATDGVSELLERGGTLDRFSTRRFREHPDALRRELTILARGEERIDWEARRVERVPAVLQDDCAVGVIARRFAS